LKALRHKGVKAQRLKGVKAQRYYKEVPLLGGVRGGLINTKTIRLKGLKT
jgi:hypothetical protein